DYDETGTNILIDTKVAGEDRKIVSHAGRNGYNYVFDRLNGQFLKAAQHVGKVTWTKGIDPKTGKPVDYDPPRATCRSMRSRPTSTTTRPRAASVPTTPAAPTIGRPPTAARPAWSTSPSSKAAPTSPPTTART